MNKVAKKLTFTTMGLEPTSSWSRRKSQIFGESSIRSGNGNPTDFVQSQPGLRSRRFRNSISAVAIAALLGGSFVYLRPALAQVPALTFEVLAGGFSPERIRINEKGPSAILQTKIVVQPGGDTGWHTHPGPVIVVVKTGAVTEFHSNGCVSVHPAGSVFLESAGEVHKVINEGSDASESYATFIIPPGSQPLQPAADPGNAVCR
jgi:quercetin dioxygenase-like cupin family protein